jgi:hypothetical protein
MSDKGQCSARCRERDAIGIGMLIHKRNATQVGKIFNINHAEMKLLLCFVAYGLLVGSTVIGQDKLIQWVETNGMKRGRYFGIWSGLLERKYIEQIPGKARQASWRLTQLGKNVIEMYMIKYWETRKKLKKTKPEIESLEEYLKD